MFFFLRKQIMRKKKEGAHIVYIPSFKKIVWVVDVFTKECFKTEPPLTSQKKKTTT